ncbi:unnamed protein product, partial [Ectocarpus fasciculatus]
MSDSGGGEGLGQWLVDLVMKPGSSLQLVPFINVVLCILVGLLVYVAASGEASIHVYVMGFLAIGLMGSINWWGGWGGGGGGTEKLSDDPTEARAFCSLQSFLLVPFQIRRCLT